MSDALNEQREAALTEMKAVADIAATRTLSDEESATYDSAKARVNDIDKRMDMVAGAAAAAPAIVPPVDLGDGEGEKRSEMPRVSSELRDPGHYQNGGRRSYFHDMYLSAKGNAEAVQRMTETSHHATQGMSAEQRDLSMGTDTAGGHLVAPVYLNDLFVEFARSSAPVLENITSGPLPAGTDTIVIPRQDGGTAAAILTENSALQETDATMTSHTANVYYYGAKQDMSIPLFERGVPGADRIILADLARAVVNLQGTHVISGSGSSQPTGMLNVGSAGSVTYTDASPTAYELFASIGEAINDVHTGSFVMPSHILMHPRRINWMRTQRDGDNRPLATSLSPANGMFSASGAPEGYAGEILGIPVIADANVTTTANTSQDRIVVYSAADQLCYRGAPDLSVDLSERFSNFQAVVRAVQAMAFTNVQPSSVSIISGTGLTTPTWA